MAQYAQLDDNNIVLRVIVIEQTELDTGNWGDPAQWKQTSYNTKGGVYYTPNTQTPDPDQSKAFRKNFAGIGCTFLPDGPEGAGFTPPSPYPSWVINSFSYLWEAPIPMPVPNNPPAYIWDEATVSWIIDPTTPPPITEPGATPNVIG